MYLRAVAAVLRMLLDSIVVLPLTFNGFVGCTTFIFLTRQIILGPATGLSARASFVYCVFNKTQRYKQPGPDDIGGLGRPI